MSILSAEAQKQVEEALVEDGVITEEKLTEAHKEAESSKQPLFSVLASGGYVPSEDLAKTIAHITKIPFVSLVDAKVDAKTLSLIPEDIAKRFMAVPLGEMQNRIVVAMLDAANVQAVDFLSKKIGRAIKVYASSEEGIRNVLAQYSGAISSDVAGVLGEHLGTANDKPEATEKQSAAALAMSQDSPISKALSTVLEYGARNNASDIHIEPLENALKVRARIDGVLREVAQFPKETEAPFVSRIKILSNLKIDEHRIPQDGQFSINVGGKIIDLRIAISPVVWGEQVVIRLLDKSGTSLKLEDMGYYGRSLRTILEGLQRSNGMILTSGPTGSGKSTSLYALLQKIKSEEINIVTLEDPVEYKMPGINQIQVNTEVGLTFASGLRSILRQDPNVVMVGEIRDKETAQLGVQAALTGHLVFSTLHTNSAAGILPRLLDMDIGPFLIASTVHTVIGQRLLRRLVPGGEAYSASPTEVAAIQQTIGHLLPKTAEEMPAVAKDLGYSSLPLANQNAYTLYKGKETSQTPDGFKGRIGIYEVFNITEEIRQLILERSTSSKIQKAARAQGMVTMREDGYLKALAGLTTIDEVNRVAAEGNL